MDRRLLTSLLQTSRAFQFNLLRIKSFTMTTNRILHFDVQPEPNINSSERTYENSIKKLNSLQTNFQVIASISQNRSQSTTNIPETIVYLERGGLSLSQLDSINVIHVSGTKGKGTTCAFVESILRNAGLRTGFFSSPHLVAVRERIRINGIPLSEQKFSQYFFDVYERLRKHRTSENDMPAYFRFLTCMAYYVFFHEKVDVAIMEVGIGGTYDSTNIVRKPKVVGVTSLGLDHQNILGNTIEEIAAQKAGIMKPNVPAITVYNHPPEVYELLRLHADSVRCPLYKAPPIQDYNETIVLGVDDGQVSRVNASLAIQLSNVFLAHCFPSKIAPRMIPFNTNENGNFQNGLAFPLESWHLTGLKNCTWHGRFQVLQPKENLFYYLDGAHTEESLTAAKNWFLKMTRKDSIRALVFYITGNRDAEKLMKPFAGCFDLILFCPLVISTSSNYKQNPGVADNWSSTRSDEMKHCQALASTWETLRQDRDNSKTIILNSVQATLQYLDSLSTEENTKQIVPDKCSQRVNVLFTGSLHMVGTFLSILDPQLSIS